MAISTEVREQLARKFEALLPHLNERQQRLMLGTEAQLLDTAASELSLGQPESAKPPCAKASSNLCADTKVEDERVIQDEDVVV